MTSTITDRVYGESSTVAVKAPCVTVAMTPISLNGLAAIGGYTPQPNDRILVAAQTDPTTNGIYNASVGAWQRSGDFDGPYDCTQGTLIVVYYPNAGSTIYQLSTLNPIIGTTPLYFGSFLNPNLIYPQTAAEAAVGVMPVSYFYPPGNVFRYETTGQIGDWLAGTAAYDHGLMIQAAVNTGQPVFMPAGNPYVKTPVTIAVPGQRIEGAGTIQTVLSVPSTFNLSALGIFICAQTAQPGPDLQDFWISFYQPDTAVYANLIAYPPAIYMNNNQPRGKLRRLRITLAKTCIDARTNSGGSYFEDLELSHFDFGLRFNANQDTERVIDCHFWPFGPQGSGGFTTNQLILYMLISNVGIEMVNAQAVVISGAVWLCGMGCTFAETIAANMWCQIVASQFDTGNGLSMSGGEVTIASSYFSQAAGYLAITHTGGSLDVSDSEIQGNNTPGPAVNSNNTSGLAARISLTDCLMNGFINNTTAFSITAPTGLTDAIISDNIFTLPQNTNVTNPLIVIGAVGQSVRLSFQGNTANDKGTGTGLLVSCLNDNSHNISGNTFLGWGAALPAGTVTSLFSGNVGCAQNGVPILATNKGTSSIAAATSVVVTHGVNVYGSAPSADQIIITPTSDPGSGIRWWISATSLTTFTLTTSAAASFNFGWQVTNANGT